MKIVRPVERRLNSKLPGCCKAYIDSLESNIAWHRLLERLHDTHTGTYSNETRARKISLIDEEGKAYMRRAEKICRKIKCCSIDFSPEAAIWIRRVQVYYSILHYHKGKIKNRGNLKGAARQCNSVNSYKRNRSPTRGMQEGMFILSRTREKIPAETFRGEEKSCKRERR